MVRSRKSHLLLLVMLTVFVGCKPGLGEGNEEEALELVYDRDGIPAFAGQALMIQNCGAGGFCHTEPFERIAPIGPAERFGAPAGFGIDLRVASTSNEAEMEAAGRLLRDQLWVLNNRNEIWEQVHSGAMPPPGTAGAQDAEQAGVEFDRLNQAGDEFTPLPGLDTDEGREILRNWLAARAPVVERTEERADREPNLTGYTAAVCERRCVDLTWPAIHEEIMVPGCARAGCHDEADAVADLDLSGSPLQAHARMLDVSPSGSDCAAEGVPLLTASSPSMSLLYTKVADGQPEAVCGSRMPLAGNPLSEQRQCAIRAWIECGACPEADGGTCATCIEMRRAECNVEIVDGQAECIAQEPCVNRYME